MLLGSNLNMLLSARKDMPITPSKKLKQLQWDKLPQQQATHTVFNDGEPDKEKEWIQRLRIDGIWNEIEEDFKAKQLVMNLMAKQKRAELKSVLDPQTKKRVEILIQRVRQLEPEEIARRIQQFNQELCTEVFLSELKPVLPTPEQVGKLNVYRNADAEELAGLHPSDRLMVKLIQIDRLAPRVEGMLYKVRFQEHWTLLDDSTRKLSEAGDALFHAQHFKDLLSLILFIGNYMNSTGVKGGAFGFRVSSINKLVDTKSVNNTTLLHFLERTVANHMPDMEAFLDELAKPAEAYRVNLQDVRKGLSELRTGLERIRQELADHFSDPDRIDEYARQMWGFVGKASSLLEDLTDDVNAADTTFTEVIRYYGEDEKSMTSSEFYGIFKTFVTSYKKCKSENQSVAEERAAREKRIQAQEAARLRKEQALEASSAQEVEDTAVLDTLLEKLRNGDHVGRRARRARRPANNSANRPPPAPLELNLDGGLNFSSNDGADAAAIAANMLASLKSDGFAPISPSPSATSMPRRTRRRLRTRSGNDSSEDIGSPRSPELSEWTHEINGVDELEEEPSAQEGAYTGSAPDEHEHQGNPDSGSPPTSASAEETRTTPDEDEQ